MIPNNEQLLSLLRAILQIVGTSLMAKGVVTTADWTTYSGAIMMIVPIAWGYFAHTNSAKLAAVEAMPEVAKIVVKPTTDSSPEIVAAAEDPSRSKVVTQ